MIKRLSILLLVMLSCFYGGIAQVPPNIQIQILKAEDARRYDATLEELLTDPHRAIRKRAVLAAGRIGDERAIADLLPLLEGGLAADAAFALGEIESIKAADAIINVLNNSQTPDAARARAVEAAGKIAAANAKDEKSKALGKAVLETLVNEYEKGKRQDPETILLALTAALRTKPDEADIVVAKFLANLDPHVRSAAANTLTRIRAKNANEALHAMLNGDTDPIARANAARALGAAEDKEAVDILIKASTSDSDSRVRVSAIRSLAALKDPKSADPLLKLGENLLAAYSKAKRPNFIPVEQNEFIEVATALGRILANTDNQTADKLFADFGKIDKGRTPEVYIARVRVGPKRGDGSSPELTDWRQYSTLAQVVGEFADIEPKSETGQQMKKEAPGILRPLAKAFAEADPTTEGKRMLAGPDVLQAFARFKTEDLAEIARVALQNKDVQMRAAAAGILADLLPPKTAANEFPSSPETEAALLNALRYALANDNDSNDAILATLDAVSKLNPARFPFSQEVFAALQSPDHLVRKKTRSLIPPEPPPIQRDAMSESMRKMARDSTLDNPKPYTGKGTKLGQVLNTDIDYRRAALRKNGSVKAILTTEKGAFTIDLLPEDAPLTVDNFIKLARAKYFDGLEVHRVVPNFVMQDGDPRGDGNGGPGWSIRCEINMVPMKRGAVGMALSGKDTGGSQWFVTHSPQPHLNGGYTVFGRVNETDMKIVDKIVRGDKILTIRIVGR